MAINGFQIVKKIYLRAFEKSCKVRFAYLAPILLKFPVLGIFVLGVGFFFRQILTF